MPSLCAFAQLCTFSACCSSPSQCWSSPLCPAVCHNSHVSSDGPIPRWFGRLFVMRSPAITTQPGESTQPCALINPAAACVHCSAHSASRWVSTCWRHQRSSTQEMWLQSLQQGRKWAKQERKYLSMKHVQSAMFSDWSGYLVTVYQYRL